MGELHLCAHARGHVKWALLCGDDALEQLLAVAPLERGVRAPVGENGRTPYERLTGRKFRKELVEFGEGVMAMVPGEPKSLERTERRIEGVGLGIHEE